MHETTIVNVGEDVNELYIQKRGGKGATENSKSIVIATSFVEGTPIVYDYLTVGEGGNISITQDDSNVRVRFMDV